MGSLKTAASLAPQFQAALNKALVADAAGLFDSKALPKAGGKIAPRLIKWVAGAALGLPLLGLVLFLALRRGLQKPLSPVARAAWQPPPSAPPSAPELLAGKYELGPKLGEGGMGLVFEAVDRKLNRKVAVKKMRPELKSSVSDLQRFIKEAGIVARLSHPYIVAIHDVIEEGGELYLIFDFVDGKPLSSIIGASKRLPLAECQKLLGHVSQALDFAHRHHVLHRDLKPSNITVDSSGFAKVMDFGVAREAKDSLSRLSARDNSGTPAYMAPEQHLGSAVRASDVYSLGVCLYEMLTGELPFKGPDFLAQKQALGYRPAGALVPGLAKGVDLLLRTALAPDQSKRIADAQEFQDCLVQV